MVKRKKVAASDLTIGDIVELEEGDNVPADMRLLKSYDLMVNESALTGESKPSNKDETSVSENGYKQYGIHGYICFIWTCKRCCS